MNLKGHFDSQSGHKPGLQARSPATGVQEANNHYLPHIHVSSSLTLSKNNAVELMEEGKNEPLQYTST